MVSTKSDYDAAAIEACHCVLMELVILLREYGDHIALIGSWVPFLLTDQKAESAYQHFGSLEVDLAFDFNHVTKEIYNTILKILKENGYRQEAGGMLFQWWKDVTLNGSTFAVEVDLLAPEYGGKSKRHETQFVQDARAKKARGSDLIFANCKEIAIEGTLPDGSKDTVKCKVAGPVPFLVMKGMELRRGKNKDSFDIEYVIKNYAGGAKALASEFQTDITNALVLEGLGRIRTKFETIDREGPEAIATFEGIEDRETRQIRKKEAFETVSEFLDLLSITKVV